MEDIHGNINKVLLINIGRPAAEVSPRIAIFEELEKLLPVCQ